MYPGIKDRIFNLLKRCFVWFGFSWLGPSLYSSL